jgi:hypothetical protein
MEWSSAKLNANANVVLLTIMKLVVEGRYTLLPLLALALEWSIAKGKAISFPTSKKLIALFAHIQFHTERNLQSIKVNFTSTW